MRGTSKVYLLLYYIIQVLCLGVFFQLVIPFQAVLVTASRGGLQPRPKGRGISPHLNKIIRYLRKFPYEIKDGKDLQSLPGIGQKLINYINNLIAGKNANM